MRRREEAPSAHPWAGLRVPAIRAVPAVAAAFFLAAAPSASADEPYKRMFDDELVFTGTESLSDTGSSKDVIVIGLFSPDDDDHPVGRSLTRGVTMAVDQANAAGGIEGRPLRLIRRWADDPWGAGANEVVKLVFEDGAWAIIGGPDGASTHIAQQVATKAHIPLIAPVSSDPSLTHTRVPWIFRLPPNDAAQAEVLVTDGVVPSGLKHLGLITCSDHDSRTVAAEILEALEAAGAPVSFHFEVNPATADFSEIAARAAGFDPDGLLIRLPPPDARALANSLDSAGVEIPLLLPWIPGLDLRNFPFVYSGTVITVAPFEPARSCGPGLKLERAYIARHGERPPPAATYGYDAANLVITSVRRGVRSRTGLKTGIASLAPLTGASGQISWDAGGGNPGTPMIWREDHR